MTDDQVSQKVRDLQAAIPQYFNDEGMLEVNLALIDYLKLILASLTAIQTSVASTDSNIKKVVDVGGAPQFMKVRAV